MRLCLLGILILFSLPYQVGAESLNAGFVEGIWYAKEPLFADVPNRIYVAFRNNTQADLTGTVSFLVDGAKIGSSNVQALSGRIVEAWLDWTPTYGDHNVTASIDAVTLHFIGGKTEPGKLSVFSAENKPSVDRDTDGDGVGDKDDTDDDNDTISDADERARGSDPRVPNPVPTTTPTPPPQHTPAGEIPPGFEKFIGDGKVHDALTTVTEKIAQAKDAVDAHRAERAAHTSDTLIQESKTSDGSGITRSTIKKAEGNWQGKFVLGIQAIISHLWTFILWLLSQILRHPMFVEMGTLILILYVLFRTARRLGSRPSF